MALNPYTLNHLYEKGILNYIPDDLVSGAPILPVNTVSNPYLDSAMQGGLYQSSINGNDAYISGMNNANLNYNLGSNSFAGSMSNAGGINTFLGNGVGTHNNNSIASMFGFNNNIGANSNAGVYNSFMGNGVGEQYNGGGLNIFGGFSDTQNGVKGGINKTIAVVNNTPKFILGLLAGALGIGAIMHGFKRGKKVKLPKTTHTSFLSKLNPLNWFKKNK